MTPSAVGLRAFDRAIDAVGSSQSLRDALALVRETGLVGNYGVSPEDDQESGELQAARATEPDPQPAGARRRTCMRR